MKNSEFTIDSFTSKKIKLLGFFSILALLYIHNGSGANAIMTPSMLVTKEFQWNEVVQNFILNGLLRFRLPLMMITSGFFLFYRSKRSYLKLITSKIKTIIFPYLLISLSGLIITFIFETFFVPQNSVYAFSGMIGKKMIDLSFVEIISYILKSPIVFQLWYLRVLFMFVLFVPLIRYLITKIPLLSLSAMLLFWLFTNYIGGVENDRGYLFFFIGAYLAIHQVDTSKQFTFFTAKASLTIFILLSIVKTYITFYATHLFGMHTAFSVSFIYKLNEILGLYGVWFIFDTVLLKMMSRSFWMKLTESSFFVYAFHAPLIIFLNNIIKLSDNIFSKNTMLSFLLLPLIVLFITLMTEDIMKRLSLKFYSILTGGRSKAGIFKFDPEIFSLPQVSFSRKLVWVSSLSSFIIIAVAGAVVFFK